MSHSPNFSFPSPSGASGYAFLGNDAIYDRHAAGYPAQARDGRYNRQGAITESLAYMNTLFFDMLGSLRAYNVAEKLTQAVPPLRGMYSFTNASAQVISHLCGRERSRSPTPPARGADYDDEYDSEPVVFTNPWEDTARPAAVVHDRWWSPPVSPLSQAFGECPPDCRCNRSAARLMSRMKSIQVLGPEVSGELAKRWVEESDWEEI